MNRKRLIVLDLNGTILHRLTHNSEVKEFKKHPAVIRGSLKHDVTVNGCKIVFRPHVTSFLKYILKHFDVAVWTSSKPENALPMVHCTFKKLLDFTGILEEAARYNISTRQVVLGLNDRTAEDMKTKFVEETRGKPHLKFIWTQSECDTVNPPASVDTAAAFPVRFVKPIRKKNLNKIYEAFPEYSSCNTLIIDDTDEKLVDHAENHLKIAEFNVVDSKKDFTVDSHLIQLEKYLKLLVKRDPSDLKTFLSNYEFDI